MTRLTAEQARRLQLAAGATAELLRRALQVLAVAVAALRLAVQRFREALARRRQIDVGRPTADERWTA